MRRPRTRLLAAILCVTGCRQAATRNEDLAPTAGARAEVTIAHERRLAAVAAPEPWVWQGTVPARGRLYVGAQRVPDAAPRGWFELEVARLAAGGREVLLTARAAEARWLDVVVDLSHLAGKRERLEFSARSGDATGDYRVAWSPVRLGGATPAGARPNVLLIVADTLRADRLTPYGYGRDTSPHIARLLAERGATLEQAYSQAPWTLPSVASYLTSRYPGELVGGELGSFGIPPEVPTLAERLRGAGYQTAGFLANATLHQGNGFDRGFETFYTPPAVAESMLLHADEINRRALPWLRARDGRPFFLYLHYIDPHDPYENPETPGGRSRFFPEYAGTISGRFVHGIHIGRVALPDPPNDVRQIQALYDSEVRYLDQRIAELLGALPAEVLSETLVVLTADHGEELFDHGGWKHGQTLYQEQIRVPLLARWDGRIPPASRLADPVRLLDLAPTILDAAGVEPEPTDQGVSLLAALRGVEALPRLPVFAEHLSSGPRRAAAILEGRKLMLFDRRSPFVPGDALQEHLWRLDLSRLGRIEVYDLAADAAERRDRSASEPQTIARLQPVIDRQLDRELAGLRLIASGLPAGAFLDGTIRFERPPLRWMPYFLSDSDAIALRDAELRFRFAGETLAKGVILEGDFGSLQGLVARLDGAPGEAVKILVGASETYRGGGVEPAALVAKQMPAAPVGPALRVWVSSRGATARHAEEDPETVRRLRALGYVQ